MDTGPLNANPDLPPREPKRPIVPPRPPAPPIAPPLPEPRLPGTPRCITCNYTLTGLGAAAKCPECGRDFNLHLPSTFTYRRHFVGTRYWLTGLGISAGIGVAIIVSDVLLFHTSGWAAWLAAPLFIGMMCGYYVRAKVYSLIILALLLFGVLALGLAGSDIAGIFCVMTLAGIALVPVVIGALLGHAIRGIIRAKGFDLRRPLVIALLAAACLLCTLIEKLTESPAPLRTVSTSAVFSRPAANCYDSILFYEEVTHDPPWILRVGLARPIRTVGDARHPGQTKVCIYNKGRLVKRITEARPPELLAFDVIEQKIGYERDIRLVSGAFTLTSIDATHTRVTLTSTYQPLLGPRWAWTSGEDYAFHTLHGYVLEGMRRHAEGITSTAAGNSPPLPQP
jgi:hypothetical protein